MPVAIGGGKAPIPAAKPTVKVPTVSPRVQAPVVSRVPIPVAPATPRQVVMTTGASPRGVSIVADKPLAPHAANVASGNNPRGTAIVAPKVAVKLPVTKATKVPVGYRGGYDSLAAINAPHPSPGILGDIGHVLLGVGKDAVALPKTMALGLWDLGKASVGTAGYMLSHPAQDFSVTPTPHSGLWKTPLANTVKSSLVPYEQLIGQHGGYSALGKEFNSHPLDTALSLLPIPDSPGRLAGAVMRSGRLGEEAARIASLDRAPAVISTGTDGAKILGPDRRYSGNVLTKQIQKRVDTSSAPAAVALRNTQALAHALGAETIRRGVDALSPRGTNTIESIVAADRANKAVDHLYTANKTFDHASQLAEAQKLHDTFMGLGPDSSSVDRARAVMGHGRPSEHVLNNIGHVVTGQIRSPETAYNDLRTIAQNAKEALDSHGQGTKALTTAETRLATQTLDRANHMLNLSPTEFNSHVAHMFSLKQPIVDQIHNLDARAIDRGIFTPSQVERRTLLPYAQQHFGARLGTANDKIPQHFQYQEAVQERKAAEAAVKEANTTYDRVRNQQGRIQTPQADAAIRDAKDALHKAEKSLVSRRSNVTGMQRFASYTRRDIPNFLTGPVEQHVGDAASRWDEALLRLHQANQHKVEEQSYMRTQTKAAKQLAAERLKEAKRSENELKPYNGRSYEGQWVMDGGNGTAVPLDYQAVLDHMKKHGVSPVGYVSAAHKEGNVPLISGWRGARGDGPTPSFTGASTKQGTWDASAGGLLHSVAKTAGRINKATAHDNFIKSLAVYRHLTPEDAQHLMDVWNSQHPGQPLSPINEHAAALSDSQVSRIHELNSPREAEKVYGSALFDNRLNPEMWRQNDRVALVPTSAIKRYQDHVKADSFLPVAQRINRQFRNTVLPTSVKWLAGNSIEMVLRSALAGHTVADFAFARKLLKSMTPEQRAEIMSHLGEGLHMGSAMQSNMEALHPGATASDIAAKGFDVSRNWPKIANLYRHYRDGVFAFNRAIENSGEVAAFGHFAKQELKSMSASWEKANKAQLDYMQALRDGLATPAKAEAAAKYVHDTLGKYQGFSPGMKRFVSTVAPFAPWYLNSMKFIYYTLPHDHPYATAALMGTRASAQNYVDPSQPFASPLFGTKFGDLTTAIENKQQNGYLNLSRYTPMGAFTDSGPVGAVTGSVLPYVTPSILATQAHDTPFGTPLKDVNGQPVTGSQATMYAINDLLTSFLGPVGVLQRIGQQGGTAYNTDFLWQHPFLTKPNTVVPAFGEGKGILNGLNRTLNPFRDIYTNPAAAAVGSLSNKNGTTVLGGPATGVGSGATVLNGAAVK